MLYTVAFSNENVVYVIRVSRLFHFEKNTHLKIESRHNLKMKFTISGRVLLKYKLCCMLGIVGSGGVGVL